MGKENKLEVSCVGVCVCGGGGREERELRGKEIVLLYKNIYQ